MNPKIFPSLLFILCLLFSSVAVLNVKSVFAPKPIVVLMFADGYIQHSTVVAPILEAEGIKATFYIITDLAEDGSAFETIETMTWEEIAELKNAGHDIISHSATHTFDHDLLSANELVYELNGSKYAIKGNLSITPKGFCHFYCSQWNETIVNAVADYYDYALSFLAVQGTEVDYRSQYWFDYNNRTFIDEHRYNMPGIGIKSYLLTNTTATIQTRLRLTVNWLVGNCTAEEKNLVQFYCFHRVDPNYNQTEPAPRGLPYEDVDDVVLTDLIDYAQSKNCAFMTCTQLMNLALTKQHLEEGMQEIVEVAIVIAVISVVIGMFSFKSRSSSRNSRKRC